MYKIAVCDDDDRVLQEVSALIREWNPEIRVDCFSGGEELAEKYIPYEAIFLDIDMAGMNGIETGKKIRSMDMETKINLSHCIQRLCGRSFWSSCIPVPFEACEQESSMECAERNFSVYKNSRRKDDSEL